MPKRLPFLAIAATLFTVLCFVISAYLNTAIAIFGPQVIPKEEPTNEVRSVRITGASLQPIKVGAGGILGNRAAVVTRLKEREAILRAPLSSTNLGHTSVKLDAELKGERVDARVLIFEELAGGPKLIAESVTDPVGSESLLSWSKDPSSVQGDVAMIVVFTGESDSAHITLNAIELSPMNTAKMAYLSLALWANPASQRDHKSMNRTTHPASKLKQSLSQVSLFAVAVPIAIVAFLTVPLSRIPTISKVTSNGHIFLATILLITLCLNLIYWSTSNANNLISRLTDSGIYQAVIPNTLHPIQEHVSFSDQIKKIISTERTNKVWIVSDRWNNYAAYRFSFLLLPINHEIVYYNRTLCKLTPQIESETNQYAAFPKKASPSFEYDGTYLNFFNARFKANLVLENEKEGYLFHLTTPNLHPCDPDL